MANGPSDSRRRVVECGVRLPASKSVDVVRPTSVTRLRGGCTPLLASLDVRVAWTDSHGSPTRSASSTVHFAAWARRSVSVGVLVFGDGVTDPDTVARWVGEGELAHAPRLISDRSHRYAGGSHAFMPRCGVAGDGGAPAWLLVRSMPCTASRSKTLCPSRSTNTNPSPSLARVDEGAPDAEPRPVRSTPPRRPCSRRGGSGVQLMRCCRRDSSGRDSSTRDARRTLRGSRPGRRRSRNRRR